MNNIYRTAGLSLLLISSLAACSTTNNGFRDAAGVESIHKASVAFEERTHPLSFAAGKLSANEEASLLAFANNGGLSYADRLTLRVSEPNLASDYRQSVNALIGQLGLSVGNVEAVPGLRPGSAMLVVSRPTVSMPSCGNHKTTTMNINNENMSNFGCSTRSNLASMVANPADLISGNTLDGQSADVTAKPVEGWGGHELTGIKAEGKKSNWTPQGPVPK